MEPETNRTIGSGSIGSGSIGSNLAVYTVIMGDGYALPPVTPEPEVTYLCFTDQYGLDPRGWEIVSVSPLLPHDLPRSSREQKLRPHRWLGGFDRSIYVDPSVELTGSAEELWSTLVPNQEIVLGCFWHSFRDTLELEFDTVRETHLEHPHLLTELRDMISDINPTLLQQRPNFGGILARHHHHPACVDAMEYWFALVLRYSRRDQLSFPLALTHFAEGRVFIFQHDIHASAFHRWPIEGYKRPARYLEGYLPTQKPPSRLIRVGQGLLRRIALPRQFQRER